MSWLSELFGGGDDSQTLINQAWAQYFQQQEQQRQQEEARKAQQAAQDAETARQQEQQREFDAQIALLQQQNQPTDLEKAQQQQQLTDLGTEQQRQQLRQAALGQVNQAFAPEFEQSALPTTFDDPFIQTAAATERAKADQYLQNLLKRNVITQQGFEGGEKAATAQDPTVRAQLADVGDQLLAAQRGKYTDIANRARNTASTLDIGQTFDPSVYTGELGTAESEFGKNFGDIYASRAPKDLYDLKSLATAAGSAQGAQNLAFDPAAVQGGTTDETAFPIPPKRRVQTAVF